MITASFRVTVSLNTIDEQAICSPCLTILRWWHYREAARPRPYEHDYHVLRLRLAFFPFAAHAAFIGRLGIQGSHQRRDVLTPRPSVVQKLHMRCRYEACFHRTKIWDIPQHKSATHKKPTACPVIPTPR